MRTRNEWDPLETVAQGNPLPSGETPSPDSDTVQRVLALTASKARRSQRKKRAFRIAAVAAASLAAVAASLYFSRTPTQANGVACYAGPTLQADFAVVIPEDAAASPVDVCRPLWLDGSLSNPSVAIEDDGPDLTGCVDGNGRLHVFPSADLRLCQRLELFNASEEQRDVATDRVQVAEALENIFGQGGCINMDTARVEIEAILSAVEGGDTWTLDVGVPTAERPCASYHRDTDKRIITLIPIPRPPEG